LRRSHRRFRCHCGAELAAMVLLFSLDAFVVFASAETTKPIEESAKINPSTLFIVFPLLTKN